ncbi:hypothetical protein EAG_14476 [Camponotus floridanus]|uniref:Uncharacterized protein n=1 Tax=Camponotus floridanus TaxID=104421 RepID=E2APT2_CAMFO|nr:hypothetical protein EAG_14476 [Camponotus floridanus]
MAQEIPETTYEPEVEEDARRKRERRVVQEGTALWRRRKEELQRQKHREQRELQKILASYSPWGKPGGGAPCAATLRKKNVPLEPPELPRCHSYGQVKPLGTDCCVCSRSFFFPSKLSAHLAAKTLPHKKSDPAVSDDRMHVSENFQLYCWTRYRLVMPANTRNLVMDFPCMLDTRHFSHGNNFEKAAVPPGPNTSYPFELSRRIVDFSNHVELETLLPQSIASETQPLQDSRNLYNEEVQMYELTGGVELVPLLSSRRYQSHPQTTRYLATDATRPGYMIESLRALNVANREHIADLAEQIRRKRDRALEERRIEQEGCRRHFDTWKRLWGRPGHGAPIDHAQRNNLYNILHRSAIY